MIAESAEEAVRQGQGGISYASTDRPVRNIIQLCFGIINALVDKQKV